MARIEIDGPSKERGAALRINGHDTPDLCDFSLSFGVDEPVRCTLSVLASGDLHFSGDADLHVTIHPLPGFRILESRNAAGIKTYTCEPDAARDAMLAISATGLKAWEDATPFPSEEREKGSPIARAEEKETSFARFVLCWCGFHKWRIGRIGEFPQGHVGCNCGARKPFDLFRK